MEEAKTAQGPQVDELITTEHYLMSPASDSKASKMPLLAQPSGNPSVRRFYSPIHD